MSESTAQLVRGLAPIAALALGFVLERIAPHTAIRPEWRANLGLWFVGAVLVAIVCGSCGWAIAGWAQASGVGLLNQIDVPFVLGAVATVIGLDLVSYAWHRANHEVPFLWRFHLVHHTDADFHVSTALRFHPGELLLSLPMRLGAIVLLGAPPMGVVLFEAVFAIANVLEHGNFDLPRRMERAIGTVLVTPALHRWHHSTERSEHNSNYGTILSVWDRLARTLQPSTSKAQFATGLPGETESDRRSLAVVLLLPISSSQGGA